ncbi:MAG: hypothetical protein ACR2NR_03800 [Solirubrobacteraceae bacterium]
MPSLTRLVETLPDGRDVFMLVQRPDSRTPRYMVGLVFLQPNGASAHNGPSIAGGDDDASSANLGDLSQPSCFGFTDHMVVPDAITRIRWSFARQDALGFVYRRPLTINVAVRNNAAITTVTARPPCESPDVATAYAPDGRVIASYGNPDNLNRIIRPIRHGRPWGP